MRGDIFFFVGFLFILFLIWLATGGPERPISFAGPYITPITSPTTDSEGYRLTGAGTRAETGSSSRSSSVSRSLSSLQKKLAELQESVSETARTGAQSPYAGVVSLRVSSSALRSSDPDNEYLTISVSSRADEAISLQNWRIVSREMGESFVIPKAVNLMRTGQVNTELPLTLSPGQTAVINMGESPVDVSFRENICSGYLDQFRTFTPSLSHKCPTATSEFDRFYTGANADDCEDYLKTVSRCKVPLDEDISMSCQNFVDSHLSYNDCVVYHQGDSNFYSSQWRLYVNYESDDNDHDDFFTESEDTIKLIDENGLTVDSVEY